MAIRAIPQTYAGVRFRSTLEADWAATLDHLRITWQYEPEGVQLPSGQLYRPDFYLPQLTTWLEVKGPLGQRLDKTTELASAVSHTPACGECADYSCGAWWDPWQLVIIGQPPAKSQISIRLADDAGYDNAALARCMACGARFFYPWERSYRCRACGTHEGDHHLGSADTTFQRAPRKRG